ncbi:uncharacterized protein IL334_007389 [Kwoniella shivajii]|uniref:Uncharacterized protein n=1 Tax=Kwoniella shivajii TaxID=564305 RepID=A0ABZ1D8J0_9TREE|nr:hypothetical protein IL334_007389 [Kwoniella shivajii]
MSFLPNMAGIHYVPGPTAQTSGFVQAGDAPSSQQVGVTGGGLGTSSNVPKPGTSIDPNTGKPHQEGMTRAELQAKKAAEAAAITAQVSPITSAELNDQVDPSRFGGLGYSPLVPKPGTSINPATGQLHSQGLTRADLQAKKAAEAAAITAQVSPSTSVKPEELSQDEWKHIQEKGADLLDPTPQTQQVRRGSTAGISSELSGREQAARQLAGAIPKSAIPSFTRTSTGEMTPGLELPGGWGMTKTVPFPGTTPYAPSSIYEDVADGLDKVGRAAFAVIPSPIKDAFSTSPASPKLSPTTSTTTSTTQLGVSPPSDRRSSITALFDVAKERANKVVGDVQGTLQNTQRRASATLNKDSEFRKNLSGFVDNALAHAGPPGVLPSGVGRPGVGMLPRYSLPSEEPAGAVPGEHTSGVGALPGTSNESGVAVLPDEKKPTPSLPSHENQGVLPGETSGGVGALPGQIGETGEAILPDEKATNAYQELNPASSSAGSSGSANFAGHEDESTSKAITSASAPPSSSSVIEPASSSSAKDVTSFDGPSSGSSVIEPSSSAPERSEAVAPTTTASSFGAGPSETFRAEPTKRHVPSTAYGALAAPLPATNLFTGANKGATDVSSALGTSSSETKTLMTAPEPNSTVESGSTPATSTLSPASVDESQFEENRSTPATSTISPTSVTEGEETSPSFSPLAVPDTRHANERTTSSASVTAIRHGHEGRSKPSHLSGEGITVPEHEELDTFAIDQGQKSTTLGTGPNHTTSLTPGNEHEGIGYPSTRDIEGASREPGTYPSQETTGSSGTSQNKLNEEKHRAEALVDAPAQSSDIPPEESSSSTYKVNTEPPANGPTQIPVSTSTPLRESTPSSSDLPHPTSVDNAKDIAGVKHDHVPSSPIPKTTAASTPSAPASGNGHASPISKTSASSGHARKESGSSEKKRGLFGKIKEKLKH